MPPIVFMGNCPKNVNRDAKYSIRHGVDGPVVALIYNTQDGERWYATTDEHPKLVELVSSVKPELGPFYINEYKQVIVPSSRLREYYLAGIYDKPLSFNFEGKTLSGEPKDLDGNILRPGDVWVGPHPGIPYVLSAGGRDIYYEIEPRPYVTSRILLSKQIAADRLKIVVDMVRTIKGNQGGRFYVNEFCAMFTPVTEGNNLRYLYIGQLDLENWFPMPHE